MPIPSSLARPADVVLRTLADFGHAHPHMFAATVATGIALPPALLAVVRAAARSYKNYLAVGRGGIPHNVVGWIVQGLAQLIAIRDPLSTRPFATPSPAVLACYGSTGQQSYLTRDLAPRSASHAAQNDQRHDGRPIVPAFVAPQRQISQQGQPGMRHDQDAFLQSLATGNPDVLDIRPSQLEGNDTPALFATKGRRLGTPFWRVSYAQDKRGPVEIAHTHAEGSTHMVFSLQDALRVVQTGWGERHLLAGSWGAPMPVTYLLVYAPRDDKELAVWKMLAVASAQFCTGAELNEE